jgi:hypothetical protein
MEDMGFFLSAGQIPMQCSVELSTKFSLDFVILLFDASVATGSTLLKYICCFQSRLISVKHLLNLVENIQHLSVVFSCRKFYNLGFIS